MVIVGCDFFYYSLRKEEEEKNGYSIIKVIV